jgi:hypothetical protein
MITGFASTRLLLATRQIEPRVRTRQSILKALYKGGLEAESYRRYQLPFATLTDDQINEWYFEVYPPAPAIERIKKAKKGKDLF